MKQLKRIATPLAIPFVAALTLAACTSGGSDGGPTTPVTAEQPASVLVANFDHRFELDASGGTTCPVVETVFTDTSVGSPDGWLWELPDGTTYEEQNLMIDGEVNGLVRLTVSRNGESSIVERNVMNDVVC